MTGKKEEGIKKNHTGKVGGQTGKGQDFWQFGYREFLTV